MFYFYANITGLQNLNTLNFKFDYRYFGKDMIKVLSKIISLDFIATPQSHVIVIL